MSSLVGPGPLSLKRKHEMESETGEPSEKEAKKERKHGGLFTLGLKGDGDKIFEGSPMGKVQFQGDTDQEYVIGRLLTASLIVRDINVSRRHAVIKLDTKQRKWSIEDQKSLNSVYVNDEALSPFHPKVLSEGDVFSLGPLRDYRWKVEYMREVQPEKNKEAPVEEETEVTEEHTTGKVEAEEKEEEKETKEEQKEHKKEEEKEEQKQPLNKSALAAEVSEEFCCSICSDVFIDPRSLQCGHVFCQFCLLQWKYKTTTKQVCPFCRERFRGDGHRNFVLESLISAWEQKLGEDDSGQRREAVKERKENLEAFQVAHSKNKGKEEEPARNSWAPTPGMPLTIASYFRGRGGGSGPRTTRAAVSGTAPGTITVIRRGGRGGRSSRGPISREIIDVDDSSDSDDEDANVAESGTDAPPESSETATAASTQSSDNDEEDEEDSDGSVEGIEGYYYGGYGHCYSCGRGGHWAHGCPF